MPGGIQQFGMAATLFVLYIPRDSKESLLSPTDADQSESGEKSTPEEHEAPEKCTSTVPAKSDSADSFKSSNSLNLLLTPTRSGSSASLKSDSSKSDKGRDDTKSLREASSTNQSGDEKRTKLQRQGGTEKDEEEDEKEEEMDLNGVKYVTEYYTLEDVSRWNKKRAV